MTPWFKTISDAGPHAPWLVLVHGTSQHSGVFSKQVDAFSPRYRILLVDLPGHGRSSDLRGPFGQVEYARAVASAIDAAGLRNFHYWGTHTGAAVGLLIALAEPQRLDSLILEGVVLPGEPMPYVSQIIGRVSRTARDKGVAEAIHEWWTTAAWFDVMRQMPEQCRAIHHRSMVADFAGAPWLDDQVPEHAPPARHVLAQLEIRTLLINGEHDVPDFVAAAVLAEGLLPRVRRETIPLGGGFPLWEYPAVVNPIVAGFLEELNV